MDLRDQGNNGSINLIAINQQYHDYGRTHYISITHSHRLHHSACISQLEP